MAWPPQVSSVQWAFLSAPLVFLATPFALPVAGAAGAAAAVSAALTHDPPSPYPESLLPLQGGAASTLDALLLGGVVLFAAHAAACALHLAACCLLALTTRKGPRGVAWRLATAVCSTSAAMLGLHLVGR